MTENEEKLQEIIKDKEFMLKFFQQKTMKDAQKMLADKGINCSDEEMEIIKESVQSIKEMEQSELLEASGGGLVNEIKVLGQGTVVGGKVGLMWAPITGAIGCAIGHAINNKLYKDKKVEGKGKLIGAIVGAAVPVVLGGVVGTGLSWMTINFYKHH